MRQMPKKRSKTVSKRVSIFFLFFLSKGDQLDLPKMGQIMFLIRWCYLTGFSCMGESFILRNQIWKNGLPGGWSTKKRKNIKKFKTSG
jgi:hypothetical protein